MQPVVTPAKHSSTNYSHYPLKKRPINYVSADDSDSYKSYKFYRGMSSSQSAVNDSEPENLSTKPADLKLKKESLPSASPMSPNPISLVAGRGGSVTSSPPSSPVSLQYNNSGSNYSGGYRGMQSPAHLAHHDQHHPSQFSHSYLVVSHPLSPVSDREPLEPISLNPPVTRPSVFPASRILHKYSSSSVAAAGQRSSCVDFSPVSSSSSSPLSGSSVVISQFHSTSSSHFTPSSARDVSGSPPHVSSPPLSIESEYPVIKIEEARPFSNHDHDEQNTDLHEEIFTPVAAQQHHPHNYHHQSAEDQDPVISHASVSSSSNSENQQPITTLPQLSKIAEININGSERFVCTDCDKVYKTYFGISNHIEFHCPRRKENKFICNICKKEYPTNGGLKLHMTTHTLPFKCYLCGKEFSRPWLLQGHIRTHTGEKPFSCQHCNRAFADRSNLRAHLQTHSEVKKYSCNNCSKTFSRKSLLHKHEDSGCGADSAMHCGPTSPNYVIT